MCESASVSGNALVWSRLISGRIHPLHSSSPVFFCAPPLLSTAFCIVLLCFALLYSALLCSVPFLCVRCPFFSPLSKPLSFHLPNSVLYSSTLPPLFCAFPHLFSCEAFLYPNVRLQCDVICTDCSTLITRSVSPPRELQCPLTALFTSDRRILLPSVHGRCPPC